MEIEENKNTDEIVTEEETQSEDKKYIKASTAVVITAVAVVLSILASCLLTLGVMYKSGFNPLGLDNENWQKLKWGFNTVNKFYYDELDQSEIVDGALLGISTVLDDYSLYMPKDYAEAFKQSVDADSYCGVGLYIYSDTESGSIKVISAISGSPAKKAGITTNDIIKAVDGEIVGADVDLASSKMLGEAGTEVTVTVIKADTGETVDIKLKRDNIKLETVQSEMMEDDIGYIAISQFGVNTYSEFVDHFNKLSEDGAEEIILDLRSNPGGYLSSAVSIADIFTDEGEVIVYTKDKSGKRVDYKAHTEAIDVDMVILCDEGTASASEVVIGALCDHGKAKLIGTKTFGKGVTQAVTSYPDGSAFKITDTKYYTPNGKCIDKKGIEPDVKVENKNGEDLQLKAAIEALR